MQVKELGHPASVYTLCMQLMVQLAQLGLVHCDFNEFNLLVRGPLSVCSCMRASARSPAASLA